MSTTARPHAADTSSSGCHLNHIILTCSLYWSTSTCCWYARTLLAVGEKRGMGPREALGQGRHWAYYVPSLNLGASALVTPAMQPAACCHSSYLSSCISRQYPSANQSPMPHLAQTAGPPAGPAAPGSCAPPPSSQIAAPAGRQGLRSNSEAVAMHVLPTPPQSPASS